MFKFEPVGDYRINICHGIEDVLDGFVQGAPEDVDTLTAAAELYAAYGVLFVDDPERATFCRDFDIPLRIVAGDWQLQRDLLGRELNLDAFQSPA